MARVVFIRVVDLENFVEKEAEFFTLLDRDEKQKADRFKFAVHRRNYILAHAMLRIELGQYLQMDPADISFRYGPYGKPFVINSELHFNMSHTKNKVLYGFSWEGEIGVDIEYINPTFTLDDLPLSVLSEAEKQQILGLPTVLQKEAFYKLWTRKEAYLKAVGIGLQDLSVTIPSDWHFMEPFRTDAYVSSIAFRKRVDRCL